MSPPRPRRRTAALTSAAVLAGMSGALLFGSPAAAHVEVEADKPQAGAQNVTLTFTGEAESTTAGINSERVVLPAGITPDAVTLGKAPAGWTLAPTADGFTISGTALKPRQDAVFSVVVAQLPTDSSELAFKTIESYSDGKVSRWIELAQPGQSEPESPAPVLKVTGASSAPASPSSAPASSAPASSAPAATTSAAAASDEEDSGSSTMPLILVGLVVLIAGSVALLVVTRRRKA